MGLRAFLFFTFLTPCFAQGVPNYTTAVSLVTLLDGGVAVPSASLCATPADAHGAPLTLSAISWGILLKNARFCQPVVNGALTTPLRVPDACHTNNPTPITYNFTLQKLDTTGAPLGVATTIPAVPNVCTPTYSLDTYAPVAAAAMPLSPAVGQGIGLPSTCTSPSLWIETDAPGAYICKAGAYVPVLTSGTPGPVGPAGATGPAGLTGQQGIPGVAGPAGVKGDNGATGPAGQQGIQGGAGVKGDTGPAGAAGPQGLQGIPGAQGAQGAASTVPGPTGQTGPAGSTGPQGAASTVPGPQGATGPQGLQGLPGAQGPQGLASSVPGPAGPTGPTGAQGASSTVPGPQGPAGAMGQQGPIGPAGSVSTFALSASGNQSAPSTYDGVARSFALCPVGGCVVQIEPTYPYGAESALLPTGPNQMLVDLRGGSDHRTSNDASYGPNGSGSYGFGQTCLSQGVVGDCLRITHTITTPGINNGNVPGLDVSNWWTVGHGLQMTVNCQNEGICAGFTQYLNHQGSGDTNNYRYVTTWGGARDLSGEFTQGDALSVIEAGTYYSGSITSTSGFHVNTVPTGSTGSLADIGTGQRLVDTTPSSLLATGYVTSKSTLLDATVFGISGTVTPSTWWGTLDATITVPTIMSTGNNTIGTLTTWSMTTVGGAGVPTVGAFINLASWFSESAQITAVTPGAAGHFTLQGYVRKSHGAGGLGMVTPWARGGFEFTANTIPIPGGNQLRYDLDAIGATDTHSVVVVQYYQGAVQGVSMGNVLMDQISTGLGPLTNSNGVVTIPLDGATLRDKAVFQNTPIITISGAVDAAYNGPCLNARNPQSTTYPSSLQCDQAASAGHAPSVASYFTLGATGYGNTGFNLRPLAQVVDIQTYTAGARPTATGNLRLEPNAMPLPVGGTVALDHDYAMTIVGQHLGIGFANPYAGNNKIVDWSVSGFDGSSQTGINYVDPFNTRVGLGGTRSTPPGPAWVHGLANGIGGMDYAPWPSGSPAFIYGCPPSPVAGVSGCANTYYYYDLQRNRGMAADGVNVFDYATHFLPFSGTYILDYRHVEFPNVPTGTNTMTFACFQLDASTGKQELVSSPNPCNGAATTPAATAPTITTQPLNSTIASGQTAILTVAATGTAPLAYQWYAGTSPSTVSPVAGATTTSFTTPALTASASYWVQASNSAGTANSSTAAITVTAPSGYTAMTVGRNGNLNGFQPFAGSSWTQLVTTAAVDSTTSAWVTENGSNSLHPDFDNSIYGIPYNVVDSSVTPQSAVAEQEYPDESDITSAPIPTSPAIESSPANCDTTGNDNHMIVLDKATGFEYEWYHFKPCNGVYNAGNSAVWDLAKNNDFNRPWGMTSVDAAGLSVFAGLVKYEEATTQTVPATLNGLTVQTLGHAIRFTMQNIGCDHYAFGDGQAAIVPPATHGSCTNSGTKSREAMTIRLKPSYNCAAFTGPVRVICNTMQTYGMKLADLGTSGYLTGTNDSRWDPNNLQYLSSIQLSQFEIIAIPQVYSQGGSSTSIAFPVGNAPTNTTPVANPSTITAGQCSTLTWTSTGATHEFLQNGHPSRTQSSIECPTATTTYVLNSDNQYGRTASGSVTVTVQ